MEEEHRRREFVSNEANIEQAITDAAELIRLILRAIAAKDPVRTLERLAEELRRYAALWRDNVPLERVLPSAVTRLRDVDREIESHGALVESTFPALGYLAEVTGDDDTQHLRVGKARGEFEASIRGIAARNDTRRIMRDLRAKEVLAPVASGGDGRIRKSRSGEP